jgi:endonuclease/exonuclease/phosphatase family metal-dependent hydrolase
MSKFTTSLDFYYRIKHDSNINPTGIKITYLDSLKKKYVDMDFSKWVFVEDGGDIPVHRVYFFKYKDEIIWDRENKILNLEPVYKDIKSKLPDSFTLLTWNILNPKYSSKKLGLIELKKDQSRQDKIIEQISTFLELESIDIICLQEVNKNQLENLKKNFDSKYNVVSTDLTSGDNIVFITKYSISSIENIPFSLEKECIKISLDTVTGFSINIYGIHLTSDSQTNSQHKRLEQLEKLSKSIDPNSTNIICGDFNEDNSTHLLLTDIMSDTFNFTYLNDDPDSSIKNETNQLYTFDPNTNKLAWANSTTKQPHRYDKIFINGFAKSIRSNQIISNIPYSDHYPVISTLHIEPNNLAFKPETKNTSSGLFVIIPPCATDYVRLQKFRKELDENYSKWMPHLSIHLGWIEESEFANWIRSNQNIFKKINSFEVILDVPDYLTHDSAYTLILRPNKSCSDKLTNLFKLFGSGSEPHLTLGKFKKKSKLDSKLKLVTDAKLSVNWNLSQLHLVSRKNRDYGIQLGLVRFGLDNISNNISNNQIENIILDITNQNPMYFSKCPSNFRR